MYLFLSINPVKKEASQRFITLLIHNTCSKKLYIYSWNKMDLISARSLDLFTTMALNFAPKMIASRHHRPIAAYKLRVGHKGAQTRRRCATERAQSANRLQSHKRHLLLEKVTKRRRHRLMKWFTHTQSDNNQSRQVFCSTTWSRMDQRNSTLWLKRCSNRRYFGRQRRVYGCTPCQPPITVWQVKTAAFVPTHPAAAALTGSLCISMEWNNSSSARVSGPHCALEGPTGVLRNSNHSPHICGANWFLPVPYRSAQSCETFDFPSDCDSGEQIVSRITALSYSDMHRLTTRV